MDNATQQIDTVVTQPMNGQQVLFNMEGLIKNHISAIDELKHVIVKKKEMLNDILTNDPTYQKHLSEAKEAVKIKNATKSQVMKQPQASELDKQIKETKLELKQNKGSLSDYLKEYSKLSGSEQIEDDDGNTLSMEFNIKLVKR